MQVAMLPDRRPPKNPRRGVGADGQLGTGSQGRTSPSEDYFSNIPVQVASLNTPFYSVSAGRLTAQFCKGAVLLLHAAA